LRSGLVGTADQVAERISDFEAVGVDLVLLQCSPQFEEMERFAESVIRRSESFNAPRAPRNSCGAQGSNREII